MTTLTAIDYAILSQAERLGSVATQTVIANTGKLITFPMLLTLVSAGYLKGYYSDRYNQGVYQNRYRLTEDGCAAVMDYRATSNNKSLARKRGE
jgi:hypothetical protein